MRARSQLLAIRVENRPFDGTKLSGNAQTLLLNDVLSAV